MSIGVFGLVKRPQKLCEYILLKRFASCGEHALYIVRLLKNQANEETDADFAMCKVKCNASVS